MVVRNVLLCIRLVLEMTLHIFECSTCSLKFNNSFLSYRWGNAVEWLGEQLSLRPGYWITSNENTNDFYLERSYSAVLLHEKASALISSDDEADQISDSGGDNNSGYQGDNSGYHGDNNSGYQADESLVEPESPDTVRLPPQQDLIGDGEKEGCEMSLVEVKGGGDTE
eukprot:sb/3472349/